MFNSIILSLKIMKIRSNWNDWTIWINQLINLLLPKQLPKLSFDEFVDWLSFKVNHTFEIWEISHHIELRSIVLMKEIQWNQLLLFASWSVWLDSLCMGLNWSSKHRDTRAHTHTHTRIDIGHLSLHSFQFSLSTVIVSILFVCR